MIKEDLCYLAGFFDSEGHIEIYHHKPTYRQPYGQYTLAVRITQKERDFFDTLLLPDFGGKIILQRPKGFYIHHWQLHGHRAKDFLKLIMPYLRLKKEQAEIAIQFQELFPRNWQRGPKHKVDPRLLEERNQLFERFRAIVNSDRSPRPGNNRVAQKTRQLIFHICSI